MSDERWERMTEWFEEALRREGAERESFLASIDDPELEVEIRSLLAAHERSGPVDDLLQHVTGPTGSASDRFRPGDRLGSYEIVEEIATGGMATVYLAQDTRHGRRVAVKVLRPELAAYLGADRFLREMRLMGRLQHPHILPLFDSGEVDGRLYYVMPYVEDETLRDRLNREGQLPVEDAVRIARDVAEALDYAHRNGVLHRDVKPGNILLNDGRAVVADFGIALPLHESADARTTEAGLSLGTPHYMSPEQADGRRDLTRRSDVYSLGCVLYEMLAGRPPHSGRSPGEVMRAILSEEIPPVDELRRSVPVHVADATGKALERLPADRFASARDYGEALTNPHFSTRSAAGSAGAGTGRWWALGVAALALAVAAWVWLRPTATPMHGTAVEFYLDSPDPALTFRYHATLSPDGRRLVAELVSDEGPVFYQRAADSPDWRPIPGTEGAAGPIFFSPDGEWIAFSQRNELRKTRLDGGMPITISDAPSYWGGNWRADGLIVFAASQVITEAGVPTGLFLVSEDGGEPTKLTTTDRTHGTFSHTEPFFGASGKIVLFTAVNDLLQSTVAAVDIETGVITLLAPGCDPHLDDRGRVAYVTPEGQLVRQEFDEERLQLVGPRTQLADGVNLIGGGALFSYARDGSFAIVTGSARSNRLIEVDREGNPRTLFTTGGGSAVQVPRFSPSGDRLAYIQNERGSYRGDVWVYTYDEQTAQRLSFVGSSSDPAWSPTGRWIAYSSIDEEDPDGKARLFRRQADGTGPEEMVMEVGADLWQADFVPGGPEVVFFSEDKLFRASLDEAAEPQVLIETSGYVTAPELSPDGRWLAYTSSETGQERVYVRSYPELGPAVVVSSPGTGKFPAWSGDGREIFYWGGGWIMSATVRVEGSRISIVDRTRLFRTAPYRDHFARNFAVHPSGERFVMVGGSGDRVLWRVNGPEAGR